MRFACSIIVTILLLSALSLSIVPNVDSQNYITATFYRTNTITQTSTYYSTNQSITTSTGNSTANVIVGRLSTCYTQWTSFNVTSSSLTVQYNAGEKVTIYLFSDLQYYTWLNAPTSNQCNPQSFTYESATASSGNFSVNKLSGSNNPYALLFITTESANPTITFTVGPILVLSQVAETMSSQVLSMSTDTISLISLQPSEVSFVQDYGSWIIAVVLAVAIVLIVIIVYQRAQHPKRRRRTATRRKSS